MILRMRALGGCLRVGATVLVAVLVAAACSSSSHSSSPKPTVTTVTAPPTSVPTPAGLAVAQVSPVARQTIAGFGASGAWWPIDLASFPASVQRSVADLLFTSAGISLSGYRYNIGGGGKAVTTPDRAPKEFTADAAGLYFLSLIHI